MPVTAPAGSAIAVQIVADAYTSYETFSDTAFNNAVTVASDLSTFIDSIKTDVLDAGFGGLGADTAWAGIQTDLDALRTQAESLASTTVTTPSVGTLTTANVLVDGNTVPALDYSVTPVTATQLADVTIGASTGVEDVEAAISAGTLALTSITVPTDYQASLPSYALDFDFTVPEYIAPTDPVLDIEIPDAASIILQYDDITDNSSEHDLATYDTIISKLSAIVQGTDVDSDQVGTYKLLWEKAADREQALLNSSIDDAITQFERRGFRLPTGIIQSAMLDVKRDMSRKLCDLNRELAIQRVEVLNAKFNTAATQLVSIRNRLVDSNDKYWQRKLQAAEATATANISAFRARVDKYNADVQRYNVGVEAYATSWRAVEIAANVFKTRVEALKVESDIQRLGIDAYQAQLQGVVTEIQVQGLLLQKYESDIKRAGLSIEEFKANVEAKASAAAGNLSQARANLAATESKYTPERILSEIEVAEKRVAVDGTQANASVANANNAGQDLRLKAITTQTSAVLDSYRAETELARLEISKVDQQLRAQDLEIAKVATPLQASIQLLGGYSEVMRGYGSATAQKASIDLDKATAMTAAALQAKTLEVQAHNALASAALNAINIGATASSSDTVSSTA